MGNSTSLLMTHMLYHDNPSVVQTLSDLHVLKPQEKYSLIGNENLTTVLATGFSVVWLAALLRHHRYLIPWYIPPMGAAAFVVPVNYLTYSTLISQPIYSNDSKRINCLGCAGVKGAGVGVLCGTLLPVLGSSCLLYRFHNVKRRFEAGSGGTGERTLKIGEQPSKMGLFELPRGAMKSSPGLRALLCCQVVLTAAAYAFLAHNQASMFNTLQERIENVREQSTASPIPVKELPSWMKGTISDLNK